MRESGYDMLYLCICMLKGECPDGARVAEIDSDALYRVSEFHSLTALTCMGLEAAGFEVADVWKHAKARAIRKNILLDVERKKITDFCDREGIWYMPLKGVYLKDMYPRMGMRQMADNDILYDADAMRRIQSFMQENGYRAEHVGLGNHDTYLKKPMFNIEMHRALFSPKNEQWYAYYENVRERLLPDGAGGCGLRFSEEDFYIYLILHEYKHFIKSGTGVRSLLDRYVYMRERGEKLNRAVLDAEMEKLGILAYERMTAALIERMFDCPDVEKLPAEDLALIDRYLFSGTYGTLANHVSKELSELKKQEVRHPRLRYIRMRLFPGAESFRDTMPFFYRHRWLLPVGWLFRMIRAAFVRNGRIREELRLLHKQKKTEKSGNAQ